MSEHSPDALLAAVREQQRKLVLGAGLAIGVAALAGLGAFLQVGAATAGVAEIRSHAHRIDAGREYAHDDFAPPKEAGPSVKLGTFVANPLDAANIRYVRVSIQIAVADVERMERLGLNKIRSRAAVTALLSGRTVSELTAPGGQDAAQAAIRRAVEAEFPSDYLLGVHFTEFVVQ